MILIMYRMTEPKSLSIQTALKLLNHDALTELRLYLDRHTYRYLIAGNSFELARPTDMYCLRQVEAFSPEQLLEILYEDPKVMKFIAATNLVKRGLSALGIICNENMIGAHSLFRSVDNAQEISQLLKENIPKDILLTLICSLTQSTIGVPDIIIYDANFDIVYLSREYSETLGKEVRIHTRHRDTMLYSY